MTSAPPLAGVIGWPIGHSLSPRLHGHWLRRYGIAGYYVPIALSPEDFEAGFLSLPRLNKATDDTSRAVRQLSRTVNAINDNPQSLIFGTGRIAPGPGEEGFTPPGETP